MSFIKVSDIKVNGNDANILFTVSPDLEKYFEGSHLFKITYDIDIESTPNSILVVPFVCNILPIVWLTNSTLELESLDSDFYQSIEEIRKGYQSIYPNLNFKKAAIKCNCESYVCNGTKSLCLFSGGVDAFATLFAHIDSHPTLFTIWGADIKYEDSKSWQIVKSQVDFVANQYGLDSIYGHCNFRDFINESALCQLVYQLGAKDDWWHGFQHGLGLIGLAAPIAYQYGYASIYIASSFTIRERGVITCASDPRIDNEVRFCGSQVFHDQFEYNRQQKLQHIVEFVNSSRLKVSLRVCWQSWSGKNCCHCEKCYRTICGLIAEGARPNEYGFALSEWDLHRMCFEIRHCLVFSKMLYEFWTEIQNRICTNPNISLPNDFKWIKRHDFSSNLKKTMFSKLCRFIIRHDEMLIPHLIIKIFG